MGVSMGVISIVGVLSSASKTLNGGLCGNGDISMISIAGEEVSGGVVIASSINLMSNPSTSCTITHQLLPRLLPFPKRLEENKDRRGVATWGLYVVSWLL